MMRLQRMRETSLLGALLVLAGTMVPNLCGAAPAATQAEPTNADEAAAKKQAEEAREARSGT